MNFEKLRKLSDRNEVPLGNYGKRISSPPYYYDSLRQAIGFYFNTFNTQNAYYDSYAMGLRENVSLLKHQIFDKENTVLTIIAFERFFELFIKDLLRKADKRLTYAIKRSRRENKALEIIDQVRNNNFEPIKFDKKNLLVPFRDSLKRFYGLVELSKNGHQDPIVKRFRRILKKYKFLDSDDHKASLELLNWYRDRILHNGNKLPSLWLLDFIVTQRFIPIVRKITEIEKDDLGVSLFYFETETKINIIKELSLVKYSFSELKKKDEETAIKIYNTLLYIGHLKELGRANLNMNLYTRRGQATYEYNYRDFKGRGERFAKAEREHPNFIEIQNCPCCGVLSLTRYNIPLEHYADKNHIENIEWVKCYTCDYHLRYTVGDPHLFELSPEIIFKMNYSN